MKSLFIALGFALACSYAAAQVSQHEKLAGASTAKSTTKYGSNPAAGKTFVHDGVKLYYEVYGTGQPLLVIHGNGSSIGELKAQIEYFRKRYKVIAMDSRDHGKSELARRLRPKQETYFSANATR